MAVSYDYVAGLYRNLLGREGSPGEIEGHLNNPGGEQGLYDFFTSSPEYASSHGGTPSWQNDQSGNVVPYAPPPMGNIGAQGEPTSGTMPVGGGGGGSYIPPVPIPGGGSGSTLAQQYNPGNLGRGFMYDNFVDPNMNTPKYQFARIASGYAATPSSLQAIANDSRFKEAFPNARVVGKDSIDFGPGIGIVDVGAAFNDQTNTGQSWQWLTADQAGGGAAGKSLLPATRSTGTNYGGPGSPGIYGSNGSPVQQVGQDPFSELITNAIGRLVENEGQSQNGADLMATLRDIISGGGQLPNDTRMKRFESARELMAKGERTATNDARAALADRGLLSEPGNASGAEMSTIGRIQTRNAEEFARALREIGIAEDDASNSRLTSALGMAIGLDNAQSATLLNAIGAGSGRQAMLSDIALRSLEQNMSWNMFLAQFGLDRDKAMYQIQNGQIDQILPYLTLFMQLAQGTQRGYI